MEPIISLGLTGLALRISGVYGRMNSPTALELACRHSDGLVPKALHLVPYRDLETHH